MSFSALTGSSQTFKNSYNGVPVLNEFLCILAFLECARIAQNNYSMADFSTFFHYIDPKMCRKWPEICAKKKSFLKCYDLLRWNFELGGLLNDQGKKAYFNKFSWGIAQYMSNILTIQANLVF